MPRTLSVRKLRAGSGSPRSTVQALLIGVMTLSVGAAETLAMASLAAGAGTGVSAGQAAQRAALTVKSVPDGAMVQIDSEMMGETPLDLTDLTPGEHRITVSKAGFLENSRLINLEVGLWETVEIRVVRGVV